MMMSKTCDMNALISMMSMNSVHLMMTMCMSDVDSCWCLSLLVQRVSKPFITRSQRRGVCMLSIDNDNDDNLDDVYKYI